MQRYIPKTYESVYTNIHMSKRVYVDTNIFIDFLCNRYEKSCIFIEQTIACKFHIVISDLVVKELNKQVQTDFLLWLKACNKISILKTNQKEKNLADTYQTHYADALHAAHAAFENIPLVTRNIKDFKHLPIHTIHVDDI